METTTTEPTELTPEQQARQDAENAVKDAAYNVTLAVARFKEITINAGHIAYITAYEADETDINTLCNALTKLAHQLRHDPPNLADRIDDLIATLNTLEAAINHQGA